MTHLSNTAAARHLPPLSRAVPGAFFGEAPVPGRPVDGGMGSAVARRTVFRPGDLEDFGRVADRVAEGNMSLLGREPSADDLTERARLRNAIATGALITSGRHLQHGDGDQAKRNMEVFTNCATAIASFAKFYLLLNGSGVGRAYDDELMAVDWSAAPDLRLHLSPLHPDYPRDRAGLLRFGVDFGLVEMGTGLDGFSARCEDTVRSFMAAEFLANVPDAPAGAVVHRVADSREGWAKAVEILESMAFRRESGRCLVLDFSGVRQLGAPIRGMQGRPASGPWSLMRGLLNIRRHVIVPARERAGGGDPMPVWEQSMLVDHHLSVEVQVGGARRAARMATKSWRDPGAMRFVRIKSEGGLWTSNNSLMVDSEFWDGVARVRQATEAGAQASTSRMDRAAFALFAEATRCSYINGEPGFINGDMLEDHRTGNARLKPTSEDGGDFCSDRYQVDEAAQLLGDLSRRAAASHFPVTTNPCGEVSLHVTGGYCVHGNTRILHRGGYDRIRDLVGRGVEVFNGKDWSVVAPFQTGVNQRLLRVTLSDGSYLDCTPYHRFSIRGCRQGHNWYEIEAKDLQMGSILPTFRVSHDILGASEPEAYTYGAFLGDGSIELRGDTGAYRYTIPLYEGKHHLPVTGSRGGEKENTGIIVSVGHLHHLRMHELKGDTLPNWVFGLDRESTLEFIRGWLDTDGCHHQDTGGVSITTGYEEKARGLQLILRRVGLSFASVRQTADVGDLTNFGARTQPLWQVYIPSSEAGMLNAHRVKTDFPIDLENVTRQPRVVSVVEIDGEHDTYCFTEPKRGMGVFGNMLTHQCVIADFAPLLACPVPVDDVYPGLADEDVAARWDARVEDSVRLAVRFLIRANRMNALYGREVSRTNRIGVGPTGLHEWAWVRFGLTFDDLLDEERSSEFWSVLESLSHAAKEEASAYGAELEMADPTTVTTIKPAGTTSKLFGLTEGAHLPARRQYLRWVQFKGEKEADGIWRHGSDPLLAEYEERGYPVRGLRKFPGMSIVGFPTMPLIQRLGVGERLVIAPEATPESQYRWLRLLERHWIGAERGNQISYTLKIYTDQHDLEDYRDIVLSNQPLVRCCSVMPSRPDNELGFEYLPEEEVSEERFSEILAGIDDPGLHEAIDIAHLQCAGGACPVF